MNYGFIIDNRKCIGCHACTVACKAEHGTPVGVNRTWVKTVEQGEFPATRRMFSVLRCNHCAEAPCVAICPVASLFTRPDGIVDFDPRRCIGCKACMQACPYDALHIDPEQGTSAKCNYCAHRIDGGLEPACVIVCPVRAIVPGDLDDSNSEIARILAGNPSTVRKPEKGTVPKLFYIASSRGGDEAALLPERAPAAAAYPATEQAAGVGHYAGRALSPVSGEGRVLPFPGPSARRVGDIPHRGVLWDWEVAGYLWTKSIATGVLFVPLALHLAGLLPMRPKLAGLLGLTSVLFLGLTGLLLIKDLDRPARFAYVLLRPQWGSWLTRGAWLVSAFGAATVAWLAMTAGGGAWPGWTREVLMGVLVALGVPTALYTAFLLRQARGRDLWLSPLLPFRMFLTAVMTGSAVALVLGLVGDFGVLRPLVAVLEVAIAAHLALVALEFTWPHGHAQSQGKGDAAAALRLIRKGPLAAPFWGSLILGNAAPLALLAMSRNGLWVLPACVLVVLFALVGEHAWLRAPQLIDLS